MKKITLFLMFAIGFFATSTAATIYVSTSGVDTNDGSIGNPVATIAKAITLSSSGDIIDIAAGTYTEANLNPGVAKSLTFKGAGASLTFVQAAVTAYQTGTALKMVFNLENTYTADVAINLQDLTIQNAYNNGSGGGIRAFNKSANANKLTVNLTNVNMTNNQGTNGGAIVLQGTGSSSVDVVMSNCTFSGNKATVTNAGGGGAIMLNAGGSISLSVNRCYLVGNTTTGTTGGGAICAAANTIYPLNITIKNSTLSSNVASAGNGGAISLICGANAATAINHVLWLENSTFYANQTTGTGKVGGAVCFKTCATGQAVAPAQTVTINHCTIARNTTNAGVGGDGVCFDNSGGYATSLVMNNSIVMDNSGSTSNASQVGISAADVAGNGRLTNGGITNSIFTPIAGATWVTAEATNNKLDALAADLAFVASLSTDVTPVLKFGETSIARNYVTTNLLSPVLSVDQLNNVRVQAPDAGAYEFPTSTVSTSLQYNTIPGIRQNGNVINVIHEGKTEVIDLAGHIVNRTSVLNPQLVLKKGIYIIRLSNYDYDLCSKVFVP